jgi:L,D-peptidoglycan transpeptidase YkuD (ErfK/YbiS/YcfS/YnhG family)
VKKMTKYVIGTIVIFILVGIGLTYTHVQQVKAKEEKRVEEYHNQLIKSAKEMVANLYNNDKKEALANDISDKKIKKTLKKAEQVKDSALKNSLVKEVKSVAFLFKTKTEIDSLLFNGVLVESADAEKIVALSKSINEVKVINPSVYTSFKSVLDEINLQFNVIKTAKEKTFVMFSDPEAITVKGDITREMFNDAKGSIDSIKNTKVKESLASLVVKVEMALISKEEQEKQKEQEKLKQQQLVNIKIQTTVKTNSPQSQPLTTTSTGQIQVPTGLAGLVANSRTASKTNQIVTVVASGSSAKISLFEKNEGSWTEVISTSGYVGSHGVGQTREGSSKTPKGSYSLGFAFGTSNPGAKLPFKQITPNSYWISNVNDPQYNTWQERDSSSPSDEHLADYPVQYQYSIVINYNNGIGGGSAFFLHVGNGRPTAGCVSVSRDVMVQFMQRIAPGAYIINVNSQSEIATY